MSLKCQLKQFVLMYQNQKSNFCHHFLIKICVSWDFWGKTWKLWGMTNPFPCEWRVIQSTFACFLSYFEVKISIYDCYTHFIGSTVISLYFNFPTLYFPYTLISLHFNFPTLISLDYDFPIHRWLSYRIRSNVYFGNQMAPPIMPHL